MHPKYLSINDYNYILPQEKIAMHPLEERDDSKLLVYSGHEITEFRFKELPELIPQDALLIFNNSKVIPARLNFQKETGSKIEVFCLEPENPKTGMETMGSVIWKCMVGGASRWKERALEKNVLIEGNLVVLKAELIERSVPFKIRFSWQPEHYKFHQVLDAAGLVPLPPYIKRELEEKDKQRYQTVYAEKAGSVAAPTAGLHFTDSVMDKLKARGISMEYLTLHVGAGTFKPVDAEKMEGHQMHAEWIEVKSSAIEKLILHRGPIIAVGTTCTRTLETLYWLGAKIMQGVCLKDVGLDQWDVYEEPLCNTECERSLSLKALYEELKKSNTDTLICQTSLLITPGYSFRVVDRIITNFHQPKSTLLLLVAAATGGDWEKIYDYALENEFRFLSYGDSSLIDIST